MKKNLINKSIAVCLSLALVGAAVNNFSTTQEVATATDVKENATSAGYTVGTFTGKVEGKEGTVEVAVTFNNSEITDIKVVKQSETKGLGDTAINTVIKNVLDSQSLAVDTVTGATVSSQAVLDAIALAVTQAGGNVEALKAKEVVKPMAGVVEELEADVVVIGAGASGVSAAISAADKGAKVIIIEKTGVIGGASNLSWAGKFINSSVALEKEVVVDEESLISQWIKDMHWRVDAAAVREYVTQSGDTYDWLTEKGYNTTFINFFGDQLHMLPAYTEREGLLRNMLDNSVVENGGQVFTETTGQSLITNEAGDVIGVVAEKADGTTLNISAKSVVMATGGYAGNAEMVKELFGFEGINGGLGQNVGEGLEMAWAVGAKVPDNIGGQMLHQTLASATTELKKEYEPFEATYPMMLTYLPTFMNVGPNGARFRDEAATLEAVAAANTSAFNGAYHMVIVSQSQLDALEEKGMAGVGAKRLPGMPPEFYASFKDQYTLDNPWVGVNEVFDTMVENGDGFKGETIEELATNAGMDVDLFKAAFEQYTEATETGIDTDFGKSADYLLEMGEGPYYAVVAEINNLGSVGGLLVNKDFKVLNDKRIPINGLYAVGLESEGVLYNDTYVGNGVGLGYAFTSGRLGGEDAASFALAE